MKPGIHDVELETLVNSASGILDVITHRFQDKLKTGPLSSSDSETLSRLLHGMGVDGKLLMDIKKGVQVEGPKSQDAKSSKLLQSFGMNKAGQNNEGGKTDGH